MTTIVILYVLVRYGLKCFSHFPGRPLGEHFFCSASLIPLEFFHLRKYEFMNDW